MIPPTPATRFLARLIEDFADEWLPLPLLAFRWTPEEDIAFCARRQMHGWLGAVSEDELSGRHGPFHRAPAEATHHRGRRQFRGHADVPRPIRALLDVLEAGLSKQLFLFGDRPSIADFGLYGMLSQFVIDPTPYRILRERAVRLFQ